MYFRNEVISIGGEDNKSVLSIKFDKNASYIERKIIWKAKRYFVL